MTTKRFALGRPIKDGPKDMWNETVGALADEWGDYDLDIEVSENHDGTVTVAVTGERDEVDRFASERTDGKGVCTSAKAVASRYARDVEDRFETEYVQEDGIDAVYVMTPPDYDPADDSNGADDRFGLVAVAPDGTAVGFLGPKDFADDALAGDASIPSDAVAYDTIDDAMEAVSVTTCVESPAYGVWTPAPWDDSVEYVVGDDVVAFVEKVDENALLGLDDGSAPVEWVMSVDTSLSVFLEYGDPLNDTRLSRYDTREEAEQAAFQELFGGALTAKRGGRRKKSFRSAKRRFTLRERIALIDEEPLDPDEVE